MNCPWVQVFGRMVQVTTAAINSWVQQPCKVHRQCLTTLPPILLLLSPKWQWGWLSPVVYLIIFTFYMKYHFFLLDFFPFYCRIPLLGRGNDLLWVVYTLWNTYSHSHFPAYSFTNRSFSFTLIKLIQLPVFPLGVEPFTFAAGKYCSPKM